MTTALIGHTGLVGGNLLRQRAFDDLYNSRNIEEIGGRSYELLVCAGAPAEKWRANRDPEADLANLERLMDNLARARADRVVLISTVDVYPDPIAVDETTVIDPDAGHAYGRHRRLLELFVEDRFPATVVRLPGLFGPGLKKNVIYDLLHDNQVEKIHPEGVFQFYGLTRLWRDVEVALAHDLGVVNLATEPVRVRDIATESFGIAFDNPIDAEPARYDMRTVHERLFGGSGGYIRDRREVLAEIREFVDREGWVRP